MKNKSIELLEYDLIRYGRKKKLIDIFMPMELRWHIAWRKAGAYDRKKSLKGLYWFFRWYHLSQKTMIQIPTTTKIGKGFFIGHCGRIIINKDAVLGDNINIATGVTIGESNRGDKKGSPTIGNEVWIGTNAVIVGKITIGDDVLIAPNAYVNFDVPSHSIVMGNPGVIHKSEHACKDYLSRMV